MYYAYAKIEGFSMRRLFLTALFPLSLLAVSIPEKALYLEGGSDKGIILAHGKGNAPRLQGRQAPAALAQRRPGLPHPLSADAGKP